MKHTYTTLLCILLSTAPISPSSDPSAQLQNAYTRGDKGEYIRPLKTRYPLSTIFKRAHTVPGIPPLREGKE